MADLPADVGTGVVRVKVQGMTLVDGGAVANPVPGKVTFTPRASYLTHVGTGAIYPTVPVSVYFKGDTLVSAELVATNDPQISPTNWTYQVTFKLENDLQIAPFDISVPEGSDQELSDVIPVADAEGVFYTQGPTGPPGAPGVQEGALDHRARVEDYLRARGGPIGTNGVAAVALRFDHGLANFKNTILPLLTARQLPASLAINPGPDNMALAENTGATWADVRDWTMEKGIEVWNHSYTHAESTTEAEIIANAVTDPLAVFETELPNSKIEGFVVPGGTADWQGWTPTNTVDHFGSSYVAGRAILGSHALCTGHLGGAVWSLTGEVINGRRHQGFDTTSSADVIAVIARAQMIKGGVVLMMHPSLLNGSGASTATLTAILDYIVAERDAGRLMVLTMSGLMGADVRSSYRHNVIAPFSANTPWTNQTNYTRTGDVFSSSTATATMRQNIQWTDLEAAKGRLREFSVEARALSGGGTATLRLYVVSSGTAGSISHIQNFVLPADSVWRRYRLFPQILRTAFSGNYDAGRVAGTGTLEMRDVRLEAV